MASASRIYHDAIKALAHEAAGHGVLAAPEARVFLDNPLCGDCVEMQVTLSSGTISAIGHEVRGCLLCRASASVIGRRAIGASLADIERVNRDVAALLETQAAPPPGWEELAVFQPVHGHRSRYGCVKLPFQALLDAARAATAQRAAR